MQKRLILALAGVVALTSGSAFARGVSPYLPLNLEPEMERQIERVLILAGKPVMSRPIAAATVLDALPRACKVDPALCAEVRRYLSRYMHTAGVAHASVEGASSSGTGPKPASPEPLRHASGQSLGCRRCRRTCSRATTCWWTWARSPTTAGRTLPARMLSLGSE